MCFSDNFPVIYDFSLAIHTGVTSFRKFFFWVLASGPRSMAIGPLLSTYTTVVQNFACATDYSYVQ